jgi:SAM-dependent methyltransferase
MSRALPIDILRCPNCKAEELVTTTLVGECPVCHIEFQVEKGRVYFTKLEDEDVIDPLDKIKYYLKRYKKLYNFMILLISPVYSNGHLKKFLRKYVENKNIIAINLGSGSSDISANVSNVDIFAYDCVDLTCNAENLPFRDNSVDVIMNVAILEHVPNPEKVVEEIYRVLKPGGIVYSFFPFMQGFHASPYDYSRRTYEGMKVLYTDFQLIELTSFGGPTSGLLWILQEWIAILLSFGSKTLHTVIYIFMMLITFPIKFIDVVLIKHPLAKNISSGFTYVGRKGSK